MNQYTKLKLSELNRLSVEEFQSAKKLSLVLVLDNLRSLNNVGSAFRTADAMGIEKIYLCGITGTPPHRDIQKTALGAQEVVKWEHFESVEACCKQLKNEGFEILSIEQAKNSIMLNKFKVLEEKSYALIFGNEVEGVSDEALNQSDFCVEIPQFGTKHSLNVSVTMGILLWEFGSKMRNLG